MSTDPAVKTQTGSSAVALPSLQPDPSLGGGGAITVSKDVENSSAEKVAVQWENRAPITRAQTVWLVLYMFVVGFFFADGFVSVFSRNTAKVADRSQPCPNGWARREDDWTDGREYTDSKISPWCMSSYLTSQWDKCMTDLGKKLNKDQKAMVVKTEKSEERNNWNSDMWDVLGRNVWLCLVLFPVFLGSAVGWFFALKSIPFQVVYGTIGLGCAGLIAVAIPFFKAGGVQAGCVPTFMAIGVVIATYLCRDYIAFTCRTISAACTILKERPHVFGACFVVKVCWLAALLFLVWFDFASSNFAEVQQETFKVDADGSIIPYDPNPIYDNGPAPVLHDETLCQLTHIHGGFLGTMNLFCFLWIITWFEMAAVLICSVSMGGYFFHRDDALAPQSPGLVALGWAFSSSSGAVAESSFTITMSNFASRWFSFRLSTCPCMCNPFWWILFIIYKCCQTTIEMFSRFSLIMHGFHGGGMFTEGTRRPPKEALVKHLGTALVNAAVGQNVLVSAAGLVATIVGLGTWTWLDTAEGLYFMPALVKSGMIALLFPLYFYILIAYYHKWVLFFTVAISLVAKDSFWFSDKEVSVIFASLFVASICMMMLQFFVDIVFYSSDGLIYCYVLAAESGQDVASGEMREFHEIIQDVKAQNAESEPFAEKLEPDDKPTQQPATSFVPAADVIV